MDNKKILLVIDMQNDFITGSLGTKEAQAIVPKVREKIQEYKNKDRDIYFTVDYHDENYLNTLEGSKLPILHCIHGTEGYNIPNELTDVILPCKPDVTRKVTFGCRDLAYEFEGDCLYLDYKISEIEIVGVCTDICVISNALLFKSFFPETEITVDASCCAGTTPENHQKALDIMKCCQINIIGENK